MFKLLICFTQSNSFKKKEESVKIRGVAFRHEGGYVMDLSVCLLGLLPKKYGRIYMKTFCPGSRAEPDIL